MKYNNKTKQKLNQNKLNTDKNKAKTITTIKQT